MKDLLFRRFYAFILDLGVIYFFTLLTILTYVKTVSTLFYSLPLERQDVIFSNLFLLKKLIFIILFIGYFVFCFYATDGRSAGKIVFNLKISPLKRKKLLFDQYLIRVFVYLLCLLNFIPLLAIPFITKNRRGLPDWLSRTEVVPKESPKENKSDYNQNEAFTLRNHS